MADGASQVRIGPPRIDLTRLQSRLLAAAFWLLIEQEVPLTAVRLARVLGTEPAAAAAEVRALRAAGRIRCTADGDILSSLGLALVATPHKICVRGVVRHTWCALDAVGILAAVGGDGWIDSTNRALGMQFRIGFTSGAATSSNPPCVLFVAESRAVASVIDEWCPLVNFFDSAARAHEWAKRSGTVGRCLTLAEATKFGGGLWRPLIALSPAT